MPVADAGDDYRGGHYADAGYRAQQTYPFVFFGALLQPFLVPTDPLVQSHELLGQVSDHLVGNVGQIKNFTEYYVFRKDNHTSQAS